MRPLAALYGVDLPRKLMGLVSLIGLLLAIFVAAAPWVVDSLVQSRMQGTLHVHGQNFAQALNSHLHKTEQYFLRQTLSVSKENEFDHLAGVWLRENPEILQVSAYTGQGSLRKVRLPDHDLTQTAEMRSQGVLPLQLLGLQRAEETRRPAYSALYRLGDLPVSDLFVPLSAGPYSAIAVTVDTQKWPAVVSGEKLPDDIGLDVIPYTTESSAIKGYLVNDSSWEGLWTLRFRNEDATLLTLQSMQPLFLLLALTFCIVIYFSLRNLRERIKAEKVLEKKLTELEEQEHLSMLGEMSASIAHEINQPLSAIANYSATARLLMRSGKGTQEIEPVLTLLEAQTQRAARVMNTVRALVRKDPIQSEPVKLAPLLSELKTHFELLTHGQEIVMSVNCANDLMVNADPTLLEQVFLNLVRNSVQALIEKKQGQRRITIMGFARDNKVCVEVSDNGPGVDAAAAEHIFDSFFSTRADGLGIGLNFCRSVLERFGARIELANSGPEGARFLITFSAIAVSST